MCLFKKTAIKIKQTLNTWKLAWNKKSENRPISIIAAETRAVATAVQEMYRDLSADTCLYILRWLSFADDGIGIQVVILRENAELVGVRLLMAFIGRHCS
ncbi:hypothetical protein CEXT_65501 [Caerostris extrusa]|uniref:Uncharacterized protein n=1 Tax=Caerostris extrusa TaxID=172846 RepID=A0AAV4V3I4_CAEEX|nr:hypothetical protein CEXT_65501 [Caerostris extrusa]